MRMYRLLQIQLFHFLTKQGCKNNKNCLLSSVYGLGHVLVNVFLDHDEVNIFLFYGENTCFLLPPTYVLEYIH